MVDVYPEMAIKQIFMPFSLQIIVKVAKIKVFVQYLCSQQKKITLRKVSAVGESLAIAKSPPSFASSELLLSNVLKMASCATHDL